MQNLRVSVVGKNGEPRMPTKASRARRWIKQGKAVPRWSKLGVFYVQLTVDAGDAVQDVVLGLDPGSKFGIAVVSEKEVLQTGMLELPKGIAKRMKQRRRQRMFRRYRKCRRRPCRFNNRKRPDGWIAPSQKAKVDFRLKIMGELKQLYPITKAVVEDVRFNHYKKRWGEFFSTAEIGKTKAYNTLRSWFDLKLVESIENVKLREEYNAKKSSDKRERSVSSHAIDALVISAKEVGLKTLKVHSFFVWKRCQYPRRQLHKFQFKKGGIRRREGGSISFGGLKKGDVVLWKGKMTRVGGYLEHRKTISLHTFDVDNRRFTQNAKPEDCARLFNQRIMYSAIPPTNSLVGFLA